MSSMFSQQIDVKSDGASEISESWVDLEQSCGVKIQRNLQSYQSDEMERLLREAQHEGSTPPTSREPSNPGSHINSPPRPQSLCASSRVSPIVSGNNSPSRKTPITPVSNKCKQTNFKTL
uniref:BCL2/adenovirus E1B 19 kDa protein-interacting protein 3-like n=1 Tax=Phallusia mammillata TaxID=59560 RepID=A0A6F9D8B0_9ASCI|nr:BCL2/adenovirus E1B 19 kDa protein-interacting protein 3-like [Phallusia mammillata]